MESNRHESLLEAPPPDQLRRKLFRGVSGGVGVMLAVPAKTALGNALCRSVSADMSGNTSPRPGNGSSCSGGRSPGYWKQPQHSGNWVTAGAEFPTFDKGVVLCSTSGQNDLTLLNVKTSGTTFTAIGFTNPTPSIKPSAPGTQSSPWRAGIWSVLAFPGEYVEGQLLRHLVAAWLNAGMFNSATQQYPLTRIQIVDMWTQINNSGTGTYCPSSITCSTPWTGDQVKNYIDGMYDINSTLEDPKLCQVEP